MLGWNKKHIQDAADGLRGGKRCVLSLRLTDVLRTEAAVFAGGRATHQITGSGRKDIEPELSKSRAVDFSELYFAARTS